MPDGYVSPDQRRLMALSISTFSPPASFSAREPIVINGGMGGLIADHVQRFTVLAGTGAPVEMRGGCWSACTMITAYIPKHRLCFAPGAFLAFHAAHTPGPDWQPASSSTMALYRVYPTEIRHWIDANGGVAKMTVEAF